MLKQEKNKYRLYAQNRDNILIIENTLEKNYIRCTANEVLAKQDWLQEFSIEDLTIIQHIAEMEVPYE